MQKINRRINKRKARRRKIFFPNVACPVSTHKENTVTRSSGDWPSWLRSVGSAPCARSNAHNWVLPFCAASCKGVNAHLSVALTHALYLMSKAATSTCCNETQGTVVLSGCCLFHFLLNVAAWIWLCTALHLFPSPTSYYEIWWGEHNTCTTINKIFLFFFLIYVIPNPYEFLSSAERFCGARFKLDSCENSGLFLTYSYCMTIVWLVYLWCFFCHVWCFTQIYSCSLYG